MREHILQTAASLFFRYGYRSVGVDTISAEANIGKMTLYRHFASKDELIEEYLREANIQFWAWFDRSTGESLRPDEQLIAVFTAVESLVSAPQCYGCPFLNVSTEYPDLDNGAHRIALEHKLAVLRRFRDLGGAAGTRDPDALAQQLLLLMDGAFMSARMFGNQNPAKNVAAAAEALLAAQLAPVIHPAL